ncbi:MAG TPA: glutamine-hydrolyzing GMP synthase [Phycisphaerales bacterium]|nr:glutamine-hydrolyzing GMP synthase [Phycisphaerales bacterium]
MPTANTPVTTPSGAPRLAHAEPVLILDFGGQTAQLIARRVRDAGVYSYLVAPSISPAEVRALAPKGLILSGGPASVYEPGAPTFDPALLDLGIPVLGICYGMQLACRFLGAEVRRAARREFGRAHLTVTDRSDLLKAVPEKTVAWMSHGDQVFGIESAPARFEVLASTPTCPVAAVRSTERGRVFYGVLFHPEVTHTPHGVDVLRNFLFEACRCTGSWKMADFAEAAVRDIRARVGTAGVVCGLSGGVDSSVAAALIHRAIGDQLTCFFIDTGLLRLGERDLVETTFRDHFSIRLRVVDAGAQFLGDLRGVTDPQEKRRRIGHRFVSVFREAARDLPGATFLAQGTLYPDVIESGHGHAGQSANIKLHHNVGGLPEDLGFHLLEPLRDLFKDEVRRLGEVLGVPEAIVWRHPFPGPGLAVRVLGEVTEEKLRVLRECDEILLEEIVAANLYRSTSQVFAVLLPVQSVGVMGDGRTYESVVAVRSVDTQDFMSADWSRLPYDVLATISSRIINEVRGVNRVVYDISSKPPATIEWE